MKTKINHLWLVTGIIWLVAVLLTLLNGSRIDDLGALRERNQQLRKETMFQHRNITRLAQVERTHSLYSHSVASVSLGFESVRSQLQMLAAHLGLKNLRIECQTGQATEAQLPLSLTMHGDFAAARNFVSALQGLPYLVIRRSGIAVSDSGKKAEIEMELYFQFRIEPEDIGERNPLQASNAYPPAGDAGP